MPQITAGMVAGLRTGNDRLLTIAEFELTRDRFRDFAESASDCFWETETDRRFIFVSRAESDTPGIDPASFLGRTIADLKKPGHRLRLADPSGGQP